MTGAKNLPVGDIMYTPKGVEYLEETDSLRKTVADYVMGVHQPLIVKKALAWDRYPQVR